MFICEAMPLFAGKQFVESSGQTAVPNSLGTCTVRLASALPKRLLTPMFLRTFAAAAAAAVAAVAACWTACVSACGFAIAADLNHFDVQIAKQ